MTFRDTLAADAARVRACIAAELRSFPDVPVVAAMRYATSGGKGLRGFLVLESAAMFGVTADRAIWPAAAVEAMHAYSLIHDDLPAMDDDDLRRGQPTVHVRWDEATAILAGDALQSLAFGLLARTGDTAAPAAVATLVASLAGAAGARGMVLGQALDIAAETAEAPLTLDRITELQANKTGALIRWSAEAGAVLGRADPAPLARYATALGLAFQIADDLLDVRGDVAQTGKRLRKDSDAGKATFVSILGEEGASKRAEALVEEAISALSPYGSAAETLREAARFVVTREN
ncbi:polyprenyl synthetase family protein [Tropicimonas sp.]|uniref:polyprenyl synthetase family protein n=1 Tax=Tropicimonas sp. TaxID=2067044 RepID=UPI003A899B78